MITQHQNEAVLFTKLSPAFCSEFTLAGSTACSRVPYLDLRLRLLRFYVGATAGGKSKANSKEHAVRIASSPLGMIAVQQAKESAGDVRDALHVCVIFCYQSSSLPQSLHSTRLRDRLAFTGRCFWFGKLRSSRASGFGI